MKEMQPIVLYSFLVVRMLRAIFGWTLGGFGILWWMLGWLGDVLLNRGGCETDEPFNWETKLKPCGIWRCPFEKPQEKERMQLEESKMCYVCIKQVPIRGLLPCQVCRNLTCALCLIQIYAMIGFQGTFSCAFCRRAFNELTCEQIYTFYRAHEKELPVTVGEPVASDDDDELELPSAAVNSVENEVPAWNGFANVMVWNGLNEIAWNGFGIGDENDDEFIDMAVLEAVRIASAFEEEERRRNEGLPPLEPELEVLDEGFVLVGDYVCPKDPAEQTLHDLDDDEIFGEREDESFVNSDYEEEELCEPRIQRSGIALRLELPPEFL